MAVINVTAGSQAILTLGNTETLSLPGATDGHVTASSTGRDGSGPGSTESPESWVRREGERFGPGEWLVVDQTRVDAFAECTEDHFNSCAGVMFVDFGCFA